MTMTTSRVVGCGAALVVAAISLVGCAASDPVSSTARPSTTGTEALADALDYVNATQQARGEAAGGAWLSTRLIDYLPNVHTEPPPSKPVLDTVVVGEVVDAEEGTAFQVPEGDGPEGAPNDGQTEVPFNSEDADWQTIHATVQVSRNLGPTTLEPNLVEVGFVVSPSVDSALFLEGLRNLGPAVFFADSENPVFDYGEGIHGVAGQGTMVATVDDAGQLALPFMTDALAAEFLADSPTLDALLAASKTPDRTLN
jgi:hypothetical protein